MAPSETHEIVILGSSFAALGVAHYLIRHTVPFLSKVNPSTAYHVTIVSPAEKFFFKIAVPRALASEKLIQLDQTLIPIADGFKEYKASQYSFVHGTATALDHSTKTITISLVASQTTTTLTYSTLILATGTTSTSPLWTLHGTHEPTVRALNEIRAALPKAKSILVAGGGPAGTETAGELGTLYPKAKITLLSGTTRLLPRLMQATSKDAEAKLRKLNVDIIHNLRVASVARNGEGEGAPTDLVFSDGSSKTVDVYIDSTGGKPNSGFLPQEWLDSTNRVITDDKTMRVTAPNSKGVYAIGDIASYSDGGVMAVKNATVPICTSIGIDLAGGKGGAPKQKIYKPFKDSQFVPIGPKAGVGQLFGYRMPSFFVVMMKSKTFMIDKAAMNVTGEDYIKA